MQDTPTTTTLARPQDLENAQWFRDWFRRDPERKNADCKRLIGYDWTTATRVADGTYTGRTDEVLAAIANFRQAVEFEEKQTVAFTRNAVSSAIWRDLNYTRARHKMGLICGKPRIGKTTAMMGWIREQKGQAYHAIAPAVGGTAALFRRIMRATGNDPGRMTMERMLDWSEQYFSVAHSLIIDDAHLLLPGRHSNRAPALDALRQIHDSTGLHVALIGAVRLDEEMRGSGAFLYGQLTGRVRAPLVIARDLEDADVRPIAERFGKLSRGILTALIAIANGPGGMDEVVDLLESASLEAERKGEALAEAHFAAVQRKLDHVMRGAIPSTGGSHE